MARNAVLHSYNEPMANLITLSRLLLLMVVVLILVTYVPAIALWIRRSPLWRLRDLALANAG